MIFYSTPLFWQITEQRILRKFSLEKRADIFSLSEAPVNICLFFPKVFPSILSGKLLFFSFSGDPEKSPRPLEKRFHSHDFCDIISVRWGELAYMHDFLFNPFILANHRAGNIEKIFPGEKGGYIFIF